MARLKTCLLLMLLIVPGPAWAEASAADWPQWRGPERDGHVGGTDWPENLEGLEPLFRIPLGKGYSGPIVSADRVFVTETVEGKIEQARALDPKTGKELWRTRWPGEGKVPFFAASNGDWIRSTPSFDGEALYVGGMEEILVKLDGTDGRELWRVDFPARFGTQVPDFGFVSSPLIDGDFLFIQAADSLVKLDKNTGKIIWRVLATKAKNMSASGAFSSPILATLGGQKQLLVQGRHVLHGIDPDSGEELWSQPVPNFRGMNILTPQPIAGDRILTSTYRHQTYLYQLEATDSGFQTQEAWTYKSPAYMSSPVVVGEHAYLHLGNQRLTCLDLATGKSLWTSEPFGKYWSLTAQGDKLLALDERGELILLRANPERLEILDRRSISDSPTWAHLAITGDVLYVRELEAISAFVWKKAPAANRDVETAKEAP